MDWQTLFNIVAGIAGALGGWMLHIIWNSIERTERDLTNLKVHLPETYVAKSDFDKIEQRLDRIEDKLDRVIEKR